MYTILAFLSAIGLKTDVCRNFLCTFFIIILETCFFTASIIMQISTWIVFAGSRYYLPLKCTNSFIQGLAVK